MDIGAGTSGTITNIVGVSGPTTDPVPANNRATSSTTVSAPSPEPTPEPSDEVPDGL